MAWRLSSSVSFAALSAASMAGTAAQASSLPVAALYNDAVTADTAPAPPLGFVTRTYFAPPEAAHIVERKTTEAQIADLFGLPALSPTAGESDVLQFSGFVEAEGRWFPKRSDDGITRTFFGSLAAEPMLKLTLADAHKFTLTGFGRAETGSGARTHADVREAKYEGRFGSFDVTIGVDRRFWGQLEAGHLVDVVNQIDTLEDVDAEDKLGQPLAELKWTGAQASVSVMALPYFRDRLLQNTKDRPNAPMRVTGKPLRDGTRNHWTPDFAARATLTAGPVDIAVHYFNGLNREPRLLAISGALTPVHDRMSQIGGDALGIFGALRLKAEGFYRTLRNDKIAPAQNFGGFGLGAEYSFAGALGSGDFALLAEYYHDSRGRAATTLFDRDVFAGFRYASNDVASTEVLGGMLFDTRRSSKFITLEASRRLGGSIKAALDVRMPVSVAADDPLRMMRDDGFVQLKLQFHF